jgi:DNA repair protein RecO (recombination protein O)
MLSIETEGIVLRSYDLAEADKIIVLLTRDHGLVRGVAKGVKRLKSRFGSGLEPFSVVRTTYRQKEAVELVNIEKADLIRSHFSAASDPDFLDRFSRLGELLIAFTPPHDPNEKLYRMVKACLEASSGKGDVLINIAVYFQLWLLKLAGYLPDWEQCGICKRKLLPVESTGLNTDFFLICSRCGKPGGNRPVTDRQREIFGSVLKRSPADFVEHTRDDLGPLQDLSLILTRLISRVLGREIAAAKITTY